MAYARMQFDDVTQEERDAVFNALLSYCELDTLAMVMIAEAWKEAFGIHEWSGAYIKRKLLDICSPIT